VIKRAWPAFTGYVGVRSRFFGEFFTARAAGGLRQAVILAAGLDTRAFRLGWPPGMTVYEVDARLVLSFKQQVLADSRAPRLAHTSLEHAVPVHAIMARKP
jgi:methyltransferase (TIGR00027 family)